ncbi:MAG: hydrogenase nickel incorporation protein HypB [Alphaproteobacteria bacterium]|nr:hydrogenase nickel incorporation protein HypB [Alphaproteobacteria bacterium]
MCGDCGCSANAADFKLTDVIGQIELASRSKRTIDVMSGLLSSNDSVAAANRQQFNQHQVLVINLMSSPGSGKTALLEATIDALASRCRLAVIEGDLETENDSNRIRAKGVPAIQIITGQTCHLDANMVQRAIRHLDLSSLDILFIENVGNLVCPANFDLGQHANVTLLAVTEGDDKPEKYPVMFRVADLVVLSKSDLLPVLGDFSPDKAETSVRRLANAAPVIQLSARRSEGFGPWLAWLDEQLAARRGEKCENAA